VDIEKCGSGIIWQQNWKKPEILGHRAIIIILDRRYVCRSSSDRKPTSCECALTSTDLTTGSQYSGYLYQHRSTRLITSKRRRFCVLRNTNFLCYKSDTDFRPYLCLPVDEYGYDVIYRRRSGRQVTHELQFIKSGSTSHTYLFSTDTEALAKRCVQVRV